MIELENVTKTFTTKKATVEALKNVSLTVGKGEIYGVIGYSGAGKSTLIRCVNLLETPTSGKVHLNGVTITDLGSNQLREARKNIGMIFQGFNLLKTATVRENITIPLKLAGIKKNEIEERVQKYLEIVDLSDKQSSYPSQLSGGQKQRVAIARALAQEPDILLSDEATSALDPETTESILDLLLKINRELNITILLITHEMHVIQKICDQVAVMEKGEVIEQGKVVDLFSDPKTETTRKFIQSLFPSELNKEMIVELQKQGPVLTLSFVGSSAGRPALSEVAKKFPVDTNILSGNIVQLKTGPYGRIVTHLQGQEADTDQAIAFLRDEGVRVEEVSADEF